MFYLDTSVKKYVVVASVLITGNAFRNTVVMVNLRQSASAFANIGDMHDIPTLLYYNFNIISTTSNISL